MKYIKYLKYVVVLALLIVAISLSAYFVTVMIFKNDAEKVETIDKTFGEGNVDMINRVSTQYGICPELVEVICYMEDDSGIYSEREIKNICENLIKTINTYMVDDMGIILTAYNTGNYDTMNRELKLYPEWIPSYTNRVLTMSSKLEEIHGKHDYSGYIENKQVSN